MNRHIRDADFVLICTGTYYRRVMGEETSGIGKGVQWEGILIYQDLYDDDTKNKRFVPVLLSGGSEEYILAPVRCAMHYLLKNEPDYLNLYRHLTKQPSITKETLGNLVALPPLQRRQDFWQPDAPNNIPLIGGLAS